MSRFVILCAASDRQSEVTAELGPEWTLTSDTVLPREWLIETVAPLLAISLLVLAISLLTDEAVASRCVAAGEVHSDSPNEGKQQGECASRGSGGGRDRNERARYDKFESWQDSGSWGRPRNR